MKVVSRSFDEREGVIYFIL